MKRIILFLIFFLITLLNTKQIAQAKENPLSKQNNKVGIHILFTSEITQAAKLVNSNGGDWGYVVIPIQSGDKDLEKWQDFFDECLALHVIPIIRLSTEGDYFNTSVWRKPTKNDLVDFANFLNSLEWPIKNRYVVVFNEVNRGDEWGGTPNPIEYASILSSAVDIFKSRSSDFFIISAGLDNAAEDGDISINEYNFIRQVEDSIPGIYKKISGMASHSYPNPGFSQKPNLDQNIGTGSFKFEADLMNSYRGLSIPVFITETGWKVGAVSEQEAASNLKTSYVTIWVDNNIVSVSPFLLNAGEGPFGGFSLLNMQGGKRQTYEVIEQLPKKKGLPTVNRKRAISVLIFKNYPVKAFTGFIKRGNPIRTAEAFFRFFIGL